MLNIIVVMSLCVWAKANVKQLALACGWRCFSFAFAKDSQTALPKIALFLIFSPLFYVSTVVIELPITFGGFAMAGIFSTKVHTKNKC